MAMTLERLGNSRQDVISAIETKLKGKNENKERSEYNYKNISCFDSKEVDYTKRDFTAKAGQNLQGEESRGDSQLLKWDMINESKDGFIQYIVYYEEK